MPDFQVHVRRDLETVSARRGKRKVVLGCIGLVAGLACVALFAGSDSRADSSSEYPSEMDALVSRSTAITTHPRMTISSTKSSVPDLKAQLHREVLVLQRGGAAANKLEWPNHISKPHGVQSLASSATVTFEAKRKSSAKAANLRPSTALADSTDLTAAQKIAFLEAELKKAKVALAGSKKAKRIPKQSLTDADGNITVEEGDDEDEDRTKEGFFAQALRLPLVYHLIRTVGHYMPDNNTTNGNETLQALNSSHVVRLFDDDRIVSIEPVLRSPILPQDRGPDYYPGGEFTDRFREPGQEPQKFLEGGFEDITVALSNISNVINITANRSYLVAEANFADVADDNNVEVLAPRPRHPRKHLGAEYDAGGAMADQLRAPDFAPNPLNRDDYVAVLPAVPVAARPVRDPDTDLDFVDQDVPADKASLPEDDALLKMLGLPSQLDYPGTPVKEYEYKYGMMAGFPDRDVDQGTVQAGAQAIAQAFSDAAAAREARTREEGVPTATVPYEEDDSDADADPAAAPAA